MEINQILPIYVGTDLSRPFCPSTPEQGRDKSVPTGDISCFNLLIFIIALMNKQAYPFPDASIIRANSPVHQVPRHVTP